MSKIRKVGRNARSGRFTPVAEAKRRGATATVETVRQPLPAVPGYVIIGRSQVLTEPPAGGRLHVYLDRDAVDRMTLSDERVIDVVVHPKR
jgi:hypothetical protein